MKELIRELIKAISTMVVVFGVVVLHWFQLMKEIDTYKISLHGTVWLSMTILGFYVAMCVFAIIFLRWIWPRREDGSKKIE